MNADPHDLLGAFAQALRNPTLPAPPGLRCWNGSDPAHRLAVHRNTMLLSLTRALGETFPVLQRALGADGFAALARAFIAVHPPRSPVLAAYGDELPAFLAAAPAAARRPWLPDLARLEQLRVLACNAADALPLPDETIPAQLAQPAALPGARLRLHPSLAVCSSEHAVVSLWLAWQDGEGNAALSTAGEAAVVLRDGDDVLVLKVPAHAASCVQALAAGATLELAAQAAATVATTTDAAPGAQHWTLADTLALLIRHHAIVGWQPGAVPA